MTVEAIDGQQSRGYVWRNTRVSEARSRPVVIISSASSVLCRYYFRFAALLAANDHDVLVYDCRRIGLSRPRSHGGFEASWPDWVVGISKRFCNSSDDRFPTSRYLLLLIAWEVSCWGLQGRTAW